MPIPSGCVGLTIGPRTATLTARQIMAFAAATQDMNPRYFDDAGAGGPRLVVAPPLLSVSLEWPLVLGVRPLIPAATAAELRRGVHATHDMLFHRLPRAGETLTTTGRLVAIEPQRAGVRLVTRLDTVDAQGQPVTTTYNGGVYRGVELQGEPVRLDAPPPLPALIAAPAAGDGGWSMDIRVPFGAAHVYTECADIYNPIHTERSVALAAGLPDIILHGTATLGYAAQAIVDRVCGGDPERLARLSGRFSAMVFMGSTLTLHVGPLIHIGAGIAIGYSISTPDGGPAIRDGVAIVRGA
ncbi:MAG: FAS1-like dehydratase domain-containing protein [Dehalococcoidia bacterium]